jgi:hypothetical protein
LGEHLGEQAALLEVLGADHDAVGGRLKGKGEGGEEEEENRRSQE